MYFYMYIDGHCRLQNVQDGGLSTWVHGSVDYDNPAYKATSVHICLAFARIFLLICLPVWRGSRALRGSALHCCIGLCFR